MTVYSDKYTAGVLARLLRKFSRPAPRGKGQRPNIPNPDAARDGVDT